MLDAKTKLVLLHHDLRQLRGRLIRQLTDSADMLDVGLSALRKDTPRVPVMVERAEVVVGILRDEIRKLMKEQTGEDLDCQDDNQNW